jgi:Secretion system C-terminal sorting domain/Lamin Tail Domain
MKKIYLLVITLIASLSMNAQVVISQAYGGGGNTGAVYTHDFVELFNRGTADVDISGWSVQYTSATGTGTWTVSTIPALTTLQPGKYYLIQGGAGSGNGIALPTPDLIPGTLLAMSGTTGKLILANNAVALTGGNPSGSQIIDRLGYGPTATSFETTAMVVLTNSTAAKRANNGCTDAGNNSTDFSAGTPTPRNLSTAANICTNDPSISIVNPANGSTVHPWVNTVTVSVSNFNLSSDGTIEYKVNNGTPSYSDATTFTITPTAGAAMTIDVQLVDNSNQALAIPRTATTTFTYSPKTVVADLAALRAAFVANSYYELQSSPKATYTRSSRNQKYIQDGSAGALIDDNTNVLSSVSIAENDAISGLKVQASEFNNVLQLVPVTTSGVSKTASTAVVPEIITVAQYVANAENYESELIQFGNVLLSPTAGNFVVSTDYTVTQGSDSTIFRTIFSEADYLTATAIPTAFQDIVALGAENATIEFVVMRRKADNSVLSTNENAIAGLRVYPNPARTVLNITSDSFAAKNVEIYNIVGAKVLATQVSNDTVNVSGLTTGIYMVKITEEGKTATRKLVIE